MTVPLTWLLDGIAEVPANDAQVADLALDSREVRAGHLFFALRGRRSHGLEFVAEAAARGACAVLWEPGPHLEAPVFPQTLFAAPVEDLHKLVGRIADRFFKRPSSQLSIVGITGTNGKTTCAYLAAQGARRARGRNGGVLARARSRPRRGRALPFGRLHESDPRSPRLSPLDAGVRRGQGAPVCRAGLAVRDRQRRRCLR